MKVYCTGCGEDCSHAYGTWKGDPYHFGCIPTKKTPADTLAERSPAWRALLYGKQGRDTDA